MAENILSQEEVDALLRGVVAGEVDTEPKEEEPGGTKAFDFGVARADHSRPHADVRHDQRSVQPSAIRVVVGGASQAGRRQHRLDTDHQVRRFLKKIPIPSSLSVFHLNPLRGHGLIAVNAVLVYLLVDHFFGGNCQTHVKPEGRDFTSIQQRIIKTIIDQALIDLEKAWQAVLPVKVQYLRSESNPQFAMIVSIPEIVMTVLFR